MKMPLTVMEATLGRVNWKNRRNDSFSFGHVKFESSGRKERRTEFRAWSTAREEEPEKGLRAARRVRGKSRV